MATKHFVSAALLVVFIVSVVHTARIPQNDVAFMDGEGFTMADLSSWLSRDHGRNVEKKGPRRAIFATRYTVPTGLRPDFEDEWMKYEDKADKDEGNLMVYMTKTTTDNTIYMSYSEWDSYEDWMDHLEGNYMKDWVDFLAENDINWTLFPMVNMGDQQEAKKKVGHHKGGEMAHVFIKMFVPPSETEDFESQWRETAKTTWDEDKNVAYALRKVTTSNNEYFICGVWEDMQGYHDHWSSDHVLKLRDFANKHEVNWFLTPMELVGMEPKF